MNYELKHFDTTLLRFSATEDSSTPEIQILWQNEEQKDLFPLDLEVSGGGISRWLKHRTIPKNRAYVRNFLSKCGLNLNRPLHIIQASKGLSLNDCYWVVEEGFEGTFSEYNLYDNRFSRILALIAFTGYGSSIHRSDCKNHISSRINPDSGAGRWIDVSWADDITEGYVTNLQISSMDRSGLIMDIATVLNSLNAKVRSLNARDLGDGTASAHLTVEVRDYNELKTIINRLSSVRGVTSVTRSNN